MKRAIVLGNLFGALVFSCVATQVPPQYVHYAFIDGPPSFVRHVCIDPSFDNEDRADILSAMYEWNEAFNGKVYLIYSDIACEWRVMMQANEAIDSQVKWLPPNTWHSEWQFSYNNVMAYANIIGGDTITVIRHHINSQLKLKRALVHEFGHLLGADHHTSGIMLGYYSYAHYQCIDKHVLDVIANYRNFNCNRCNYCIKD